MGSQLEPVDGWDPLSGALHEDTDEEEERYNPFKQAAAAAAGRDGGGDHGHCDLQQQPGVSAAAAPAPPAPPAPLAAAAAAAAAAPAPQELTEQQRQRQAERHEQQRAIEAQRAQVVNDRRDHHQQQQQQQQQQQSGVTVTDESVVSGSRAEPASSNVGDNQLKLNASEQVLVNISNVCFLSPSQDELAGTLRVTNFRLVFEPVGGSTSSSNSSSSSSSRMSTGSWLFQDTEGLFDVHLNCIDKLSRVSSSQLGSGRASKSSLLLHLTCKDVRKMTFRFANASDAGKVHDLVRVSAFTVSEGAGIKWLFALEYGRARLKEMGMTCGTPGWNVYDPMEEWVRQGVFASRDAVGQSEHWRVTQVNSAYQFCPSYPRLLVMPRSTSDAELSAVATFRSKQRVPALTWLSSKTGGSIWRCSQPKVGVGNTCRQDEQLWAGVLACAGTSFARIVDCRPFKNALGNKAKGMGYEDELRYERTSISFLNIQNIHTTRRSFEALLTLACGAGAGGSAAAGSGSGSGGGVPAHGWLQAVEATGWLNHVRSVLNASITVARFAGSNGFPVMVHCSDGWDRTSQVCALAQLLLDPFFRSIHGLQVLIEKDWLSFGYKFMQRTGHGSDADSEERSPCFLLFLDCIWQLLRLFPTMFEFDEALLLCIADHLYSCKFGTFLCDNEGERARMGLKEKTISLWDHVNENRDQFVNIYYRAPNNNDNTPLLPHPAAVNRQVTLWSRYFLRYANLPSLNEHAFNYLPKPDLRLSFEDPDKLARRTLHEAQDRLEQATLHAQRLEQTVLSLQAQLGQ